MDDHITGGSRSEVERMMGVKQEDGSYSGTFGKILKIGNLKVKVMVPSGETDSTAMDLLGNKVLGYHWNATADTMAVLLPVNISGKVRKVKNKPDLTVETLHLLQTTSLTKRVCLGVTNGFVDFLGIACPFLLRFKLLMKQIFEDEEIIAWNDEVKGDLKQAWIDLLKEAVYGEYLCFPRTTRPADAIGGPSIAAFSDGSSVAYAAAVYLRWEVSCKHEISIDCDGDYISCLLIAKARVTPLSGLSIPRTELNSLVLSTRLSLTTARALSKEGCLHPVSAVMLSDSECSISAVDKSSSALKPYFHNRVSEVKENLKAIGEICDVEEIFYVPRDLNIADLATHPGVKLSELGPGTQWQTGPKFLSHRRELWPITRSFVKVDIPVNELTTKKANLFASSKVSTNVESMLVAVNKALMYSNSLKKVMNLLARVSRAWKLGKSKEIVSQDPVAAELLEVERLVLFSAMADTYAALDKGKLDSLMPQMDGLIVVTTGRIGEKSLSRLLGIAALPILMSSTRAAYLYMMRAHCGESNMVHKSPVETLARSRSSVWIVRGMNLAKSIYKNCPMCIKRRKKLCSQQIAKIRPQNLEICRPWTYISLDFAGPVVCKGVVNARARRKCWILVYADRSTKAVCLLPTAGYDTGSFLLRHEEFIARKGAPAEIVSDQGTQLLAAGVVLAKKESPESWDWDRVKRENSTSTWVFVPIGSQHHNGLPEAMVKAMKKSLSQALNPGVVLAYDELVTLLARISCSINSRPLGYSNASSTGQLEDVLVPLTPNHMLLGRSSPESPPLEYSESDKFCQRLAYVAAVEKEWWSKWVKTVLPTMLPAKKWKNEQNNLSVGDVVMLTYPGNFKDDYVLARVTKVHPDDKNLVRRVTVKYRRKNSKEASNVCKSKMIEEIVAVQRLVLLLPYPLPESSAVSTTSPDQSPPAQLLLPSPSPESSAVSSTSQVQSPSAQQ